MLVNAIVFDVMRLAVKYLFYINNRVSRSQEQTLQLLHVNIVWNIMLIFFTAKGGKMWLVVIVVTIRSFLNMSEIDFSFRGKRLNTYLKQWQPLLIMYVTLSSEGRPYSYRQAISPRWPGRNDLVPTSLS